MLALPGGGVGVRAGRALGRGWLEIEDTLDAPRVGVVERVLVRVGVAPHVARLLGTTPSMRASWLLALAFTLAVVVFGAPAGDRGLFVFLCVAALAPVAGVAAAFGPGIDPTHELALAAPLVGAAGAAADRRGRRHDGSRSRRSRRSRFRAWAGARRRGCCRRWG